MKYTNLKNKKTFTVVFYKVIGNAVLSVRKKWNYKIDLKLKTSKYHKKYKEHFEKRVNIFAIFES